MKNRILVSSLVIACLQGKSFAALAQDSGVAPGAAKLEPGQLQPFWDKSFLEKTFVVKPLTVKLPGKAGLIAANPNSSKHSSTGASKSAPHSGKGSTGKPGGGPAGGTSHGIGSPGEGSRAATVENKPIRDKWAVVIGIDKFKDKRIPSLQYASKDARDFAAYLIKEGNFAADHVLLLTNEEATENAIQRAVGDDWLPRRVLEDDVVLVFASTHGSPKEMDVAGENFLVAYDTDVDNLFSSAIELQDLATTIRRRTACDRVIVMLDACNSGAAEVGGKGFSRSQNFDVGSIAGEGTIVISSSRANEKSWESKRYQNGVFTHNLMSALKCKGPGTKLSEAYAALRDLVAQEVQFDRRAPQNPDMKMRWNGTELAMMAPPTRPRQTEPYTKEAATQEAAPVAVKQQAATSTAATASPAVQQNASAGGGTKTDAQPVASVTGGTKPDSQRVASATGGTKSDNASSGATSTTSQGSTGKGTVATTGTTATSTTPVTASKALGIAPFGAIFEKMVTYSSQGVLWGVINSPDELTDLPLTLGDKIETELARQLGTNIKVINQNKTSNEIRLKFPYLEKERYLNLSGWNEDAFKAIGTAVSERYLLTGVVDEIMWRPTRWSNRYTFTVSARIVDLQTGKTIARVDRLTVGKAPWTADTSGGKKYFENEVLPEAAKLLVTALSKQMKDQW
ncbi:MAG: caspase family protein [Candidatus Obscuribacter sp.]|nr:caspase family protein [Candidatus Obscuribacter sp.]